MKSRKYIYIPNARVSTNGQRSSLSPQEVIDELLKLNLPLPHLQSIANAFGGYLKINLKPKKK